MTETLTGKLPENSNSKTQKDSLKYNSIMNKSALLEATPCNGLSIEHRRQFKRLIGEAIVRNFCDDYNNAEAMLVSAGQYIVARSQEISRLWYLTASVLMTVPFIIFGIFFWISRQYLIGHLGLLAFWLTISSVAGALGALLSVATRAANLHSTLSSGRALHYLEGASRIGAGALSGVVIALAIHAEVILAPLSRGGKMQAIMVLGAFAGGAAERLATSIISKFSAAETAAQHERHPRIAETKTND